MTFTEGTKVRFEACPDFDFLSAMNGIEGVVVSSQGSATVVKVTKGADAGTHNYLLGSAEGFSTSNLVEVEDEAKSKFKVGDRVRVNDPARSSHHGLIGTVTDTSNAFGGTTVTARIDEDCDAFLELKKWNNLLDGEGWYLRVSTLEHHTDKPQVNGEISYEQVERGQKIRVSYESKGVTHSREGIVGKVSKNTNTDRKVNWTINVLDDEAERYGDKGQRLNWGSDKQKETIVLVEAAPEVDAVLERLLESKGGTVVRAFVNQLLVRDAFSDTWRNYSTQKSYSSETLRREAFRDEIIFFVEDTEGN